MLRDAINHRYRLVRDLAKRLVLVLGRVTKSQMLILPRGVTKNDRLGL